MEVPSGFRHLKEPGGGGVVREDLAHLPLQTWWESGTPLSNVPGRGAVAVLEYLPGEHGVARVYRRGGALRRALPDLFADGNRGLRELQILSALRERAVAVVEPLAAVRRRRAGLWQLRLVTRLFDQASPLPAFVAAHPHRVAEVVRETGSVVRAAFDAGLWHPDLHPNNFLVREESGDGSRARVVLLDLDRAELRSRLSDAECDHMLLRMARYLERHAAALPVRARAVDYLHFLAGMGFGRSERRTELERLRPAYARAVVRHRLSWGRIS